MRRSDGDHVVASTIQRCSLRSAFAYALRMTRPPIEWPTRAIDRIRTGQPAWISSRSDTNRAPLTATGSPVLLPIMIGVSLALAAVPHRGRVWRRSGATPFRLDQPVNQDNDAAGCLRECG